MLKINAPNPSTDKRALVEAVVASTVGTTIEWYDFFLYGIATALVFPKLFFPTFDPFVGQILAFSTFTIGFIARPLGGVIFGHFGDRVGRKSTLVATLLLMGLSTLIIGFIPTYNQIGISAPLLLTVLRFVQGIGVGGEWGGAVLLALEHGHQGKRGFYASWPQAGVPLGLLTSTVAVALCQSIGTEETFLSWGWRIPFFLSGLLIAVGLLIRLHILETPLYRQLMEAEKVPPLPVHEMIGRTGAPVRESIGRARAPVREVIRRNWREILLAAGSRISENACFYLFSVYIIAYGKEVLRVEARLILWAINVAAALEFFTIPLFGIFSDLWSRKKTYILGCVFLIIFAFPYYAMLETRESAWIVMAVILSLPIGHALLYSVQASLIPELFGTRLRYSGASIGYQLASPIAGGMAPLIAAWLIQGFPGQYWPLALYIILISVVSLACVQRLGETSRKDLSEQ